MKPKPPLEKDISAKIRQGLSLLGYEVCSTQQYNRRGESRGTTCTVGMPDLFVTREGWGNRWLGIEVKRPGSYGRLSPDQKRLVDAGLVHVVTTFEEARAVVEGFTV